MVEFFFIFNVTFGYIENQGKLNNWKGKIKCLILNLVPLVYFFGVFWKNEKLRVNHDRVNGVVLAIKRCVLVEFV